MMDVTNINLANVKYLTIPEGKVARINRKSENGMIERIWDWYGLPPEYQAVEWIRAANNAAAYINLGFAFDTAATIEIDLWFVDESNAYPFGATENSGALRCSMSAPYSSGIVAYGSTGTGYTSNSVAYILNAKNHIEISIKKGSFYITNTTNGDVNGSSQQGEYVMSNNLYLFARNYNGTIQHSGTRQIGRFKYYDKNNALICDLIPCYHKTTNEIGMYDLVHRQLLTNIGTGNFIVGNDVTSDGYIAEKTYTNLVSTSVNEAGGIYNEIGYKDGYRWSQSSNAEAVHSLGRITGWMPFVSGGLYRIKHFGMNNSGYVSRGYIVAEKTDGSIVATGLATNTFVRSDYDEITDTLYLSISDNNIKRFRISGYTTGFTPIITLNEEIS